MSTDNIRPQANWKKAASTSSIIPTIRKCNNDYGEDESASSARRIPNTNSAVTVVKSTTVRSHSPRKIKTQIAKLVYNPSPRSNSSRGGGDVNANEKTAVAVEAGEFEKKRQDRDKEVKEIQEMLNEFTKSPIKQKKATEEEPSIPMVTKSSPPKQTRFAVTAATKPIQRSKTDTNLRRPTARRIQPSQEPQTARSKSVQRLDEQNSPPKARPKGYSSEDAQRYMQEQKMKRKSEMKQGSLSKPTTDKEEIKKRLENLRKNTRKILDKNIKIAKKKAGTENTTSRRPEEIGNVLMKEGNETKRSWPERPTLRPDEKQVPPKAPKVVVAWTDNVGLTVTKSPKEKSQDQSPLAENHKKIGLLRKPEFKDHSFSAIKDLNMDKENLIIENLTPPLSGVPTSRLSAGASSSEKIPSLQPTPLISARLKEDAKALSPISSKLSFEHRSSESSSSLSAKSLKRKSTSELDLKIPEAKLRSRTSVREKSVQADSAALGSKKTSQPKPAELPYWLKPTLIQAYPYNFIMAVRKKLEAIANPPVIGSSSSISIEEKAPRKPSTETPLSYPKPQRNQNVKRRIIDNEEPKSSSNKENIREPSFSEVTSNFSSMSIKLPESANTLSESAKPKPPQAPQNHDDDDTTVSSSIFSSPEKKKKNVNGNSQHSQPEAVSPLATDNISNLQIKSKSMMSNITLGRGDHFENTITSSHSRRYESGSSTNRSDASVNFSQLLDDFNRSLSQVIEVNQQLKTTLVKSQIFSPEKKSTSALTTNRVELAEYVSDFEEVSSKAASVASTKEPNGTESGSSIHEGVQESPSNHNHQSDEVNSSKSSSKSSSTDEDIPEDESHTSHSSIKNIQSPASLGTQTFVVSSAAEEKLQTSTRTQTIHEETIEESPNKENMSANQYSLDSLETSQHDDYIKSHINMSRGDYERIEPPPKYKQLSSESQPRSSSNFINSSIDSEFVRIFNKSDMEISVLSLNRSLSESTMNYSSIGMYEKLIQNETNKSEHLAALLKMREKALIDRTKGQIAWLEVQKERYKSKGLVVQISAAKKKQRGILLKMEKEREEIKKLLERTKVQRDDNKLRIPENRPFSDVTHLQQRRSGIHIQSGSSKHQRHQIDTVRSKSSSTAIVRGYELETSRSLEQLLQKREEDLRRRREHVERLMEWHRRLDQEEAEVLQLERILLDYNNVHHQVQQTTDQNVAVTSAQRNPNQVKMEKKLKDIDRSLRELSSISAAEGSTADGRGGGGGSASGGSSSGEIVRTSGTKLNKLWRRLTSQRIEKFLPKKKYKLCKSDVEQLYEDAKLAVLHDFGENAGQMEVFLGQTSISASNYSMEIPQLNLNFSSGQQSEDDDHMMMQGNYSPRAAEEEFVVTATTSSRDELSADESSSQKRRYSHSSTSALQSVPEGGYTSSSSGHMKFEKSQKIEERPIEKSKHDSFSDVDVKSGNSSKNGKISSKIVVTPKTESIPTEDSGSNTRSSKSVSSESIQEFSSKNESVPSMSSISTAESLSPQTEPEIISKPSKSDITEELKTKQSESHEMTSPIESNLALSTSSTKSLKGIDDKSNTNSAESEEVVSQNEKTEITASSVADATSINNSKTLSTFSGKWNTSDANLIETNKFNLPKISALSVSTESQLENYEKSELISTATNDRTDGNSITSNIVPTTQSNSVSILKTPSENLKTISSSIKSETLEKSVSVPKSENFVSNPTNSQTEMGIKSQSGFQIDEESIQSHLPKSSAEEVSILKSLLHSNSMFITNHGSTAASDIKSQLRTNGHDFQNWSNAQVPPSNDENNSSSSKDEKSTPTQVSDETTLKSIKSIDNSTNSKHSIDPPASVTIATITEIHEDDNSKANSEITEQHQSTMTTYSSAFEDANSSDQVRSSVIMSIKSPTPVSLLAEIESEPLTNAFYESDFTEGEETNIDDISLPKFETTIDEDDEDQFDESQQEVANDLEKRLIDLDVSLKDLDATFEKALSPEKTTSPSRDDAEIKKTQHQQSDNALMPDIISEVELRRRHQALLENELKQFEHAVPYMYVREIPNKPPPPYVPPAHGSPMTTIFPSEERIKDITFRRTKELYHEILNIESKDENGKKQPSVLDENITNIYERIILDICKEYLTEYKPILTSADPNNFHSSLAFFNPPDRLRCMQEFIYKEVRKNLAMDKNASDRNHIYSIYGHRGKRDHIGEIIIQEMFEEDNIWSNFYLEEEEVLELILDELIGTEVRDICSRVMEEEIPRDLILNRTIEEEGADDNGQLRGQSST